MVRCTAPDRALTNRKRSGLMGAASAQHLLRKSDLEGFSAWIDGETFVDNQLTTL